MSVSSRVASSLYRNFKEFRLCFVSARRATIRTFTVYNFLFFLSQVLGFEKRCDWANIRVGMLVLGQYCRTGLH